MTAASDQPPSLAASRRAWAAVQRHGGLVDAADLAERWSVTAQRANQLIQLPGFPEPVEPGYRVLWLSADVEAWRREQADWQARGPRPRAAPGEGPVDVAAARKAWAALTRAGGLVSTSDLAGAWEISDRAARMRTNHQAFPEAIVTGRWLRAETERWHRDYARR